MCIRGSFRPTQNYRLNIISKTCEVIGFVYYYCPQTNDKAGKTVIYVIHKMIKYLLPQWAILTIFYPVKRKSLFNDANVEDTETLSWVDKPVSL